MKNLVLTEYLSPPAILQVQPPASAHGDVYVLLAEPLSGVTGMCLTWEQVAELRGFLQALEGKYGPPAE